MNDLSFKAGLKFMEYSKNPRSTKVEVSDESMLTENGQFLRPPRPSLTDLERATETSAP